MAEPLIGTATARVDGTAKVTGRADYAADRTEPGLAHGYLVLSTAGRGTLRSMDVAAAEAADGVLAVYSPFNPLKLHRIKTTPDVCFVGQFWLPLQDQEIRHYGQIIGLVVAETFEQARHAASLIRTEYDLRPVRADFAARTGDAVPPPIAINHEDPQVDLLAEEFGTVDEALAAGPVQVRATYTQPPEAPLALEPHAALASWSDGVLTLRVGSQSPVGGALAAAETLGLGLDQVRVLSPYVGGAFGGKLYIWPHPLLTAAAARELGRPVRTVLTQEQVFTTVGHRSAVSQTLALAAERDGTLVAVKHDAVSSLSLSGVIYETAAHTTSRYTYKSPSLHVGQRIVPLDSPPTTWVRAPGEAPGAFALESAMDELATELALDPVELRMRNYATVFPGRGVRWSGKHLDECYRVGAERFGWQPRTAPRPRPAEDSDEVWLTGTGMAGATYPGNLLPTTLANVRLRADGTATVATATSDPGTGMRTVLAMVCADDLGIPVERVEALLGDSALPLNYGAFASMGTSSSAGAVRSATTALKRSLLDLAATDARSPFHGLAADALAYRDGRVVGGGHSLTFAELLAATGRSELDSPGASAPGAERLRFAVHSFGAHFCEVRVNRWTGEVRLDRWTSVIDGGTIINPRTARAQIVGGILFGIGQALLEGIRVEPDTGRFANGNLADYLVPVHADMPDFDIHFLDHPDTDFTPLGARGIGELGVVGAAAAIANAVHDATGRRVRDLPITVDKLL
ncbi:xanthine dehydrogenase family protein molybdopterin-binding subunit [Kitasatospora sp. NPDC059646]|uniref:xanthine dehydrogenase family protein molybdopterin-binding subunit n=1 Tax=Kitasatospora sp. NPDC059646 TaxID=3346893 RepID=UPI00368C0EE7